MRESARRVASAVGAIAVCWALAGCVAPQNPVPEETEPEPQETPVPGDSFELRRETLLEENRSHMRLSEQELQLEEVLTALKADARTYCGDEGAYGIHDWSTPELGQTNLHRFLAAMPKGADLHAHDLDFVPPDILIDTLVSLGNVLVELKDTPDGVRATFYSGSLGAPDGAVPIDEALSEGIIDRASLVDLLTVDRELPHDQAMLQLANIEAGLSGLWADPSIAAGVAAQGLYNYVASVVRLVELRLTLTPNDNANLERLMAIRSAYYQVRSSEPDFRLRVIACADTAGSSPDAAIETLRSAIRLSTQVLDGWDTENPQPLIIGLDLTGDEDTSASLTDLADFLCSDEVAASGLRLFLSCGETLSTDNASVVDAYLMGAARVGGALSLRRFPTLLERYRQDGIAIETYPVSTWRMGLVDDLRLHPAESYLRRQAKVVIASDRGGLVEPCILTDDYVAATLAWDLSLADLKQLVLDSIECSGLTSEEVGLARARWEADWDAFVASELGQPMP